MSSMKLIGSLTFAICFFLAVLLTVNGAPLLATLGRSLRCRTDVFRGFTAAASLKIVE